MGLSLQQGVRDANSLEKSLPLKKGSETRMHLLSPSQDYCAPVTPLSRLIVWVSGPVLPQDLSLHF